MKEIQGYRPSGELVVQEIGPVKADRAGAMKERDHQVLRVVEYPGLLPLPAPARQAREQSFRIGRIQEFDETRQSSTGELQRQGSAQRLIQVRLLTHREGATTGGLCE